MSISPLELGTMQMVQRNEIERVRRIQRAWESYFGRHQPPLKATRTDPQAKDNTLVPYTRLIVDTVNSWLYGKEPTFQTDQQRGRNPHEEFLDTIWKANRKAVTLIKHGKGSAVAGHGFLKLQRRSQLTGDLPRIIVLDPENVRVVWDEEDVDVVSGYVITWNVADMGNGRPGVRRQKIDRDVNQWHITDQVAALDVGAFVNQADAAATVADAAFSTLTEEDWPYTFAPVLEAQHLIAPAGCYYGLSEIDQAIQDLNDQINFGVSNANRVTRVWGHPKMWAKGVGAAEISVAPDDLTVIPSEDGELRILEMQGDLNAAYGHIDRVIEQMLTVSRIPLLAIGAINKSISREMSGTALSIVLRPLVHHIEGLRLTQQDLLGRLNSALLEMGGKGSGIEVTTQWPELLPGDPLEERQTALLDEQLGVSMETLLEALGYDPDQEAERKQAERDVALEQQAKAFDRGHPQPEPAPPQPRMVTKDVTHDAEGRITRVVETHK